MNPNTTQTVEDVELNIELLHDYKPGDKLCLQLSQFPEALKAINNLTIPRTEHERLVVEAAQREINRLIYTVTKTAETLDGDIKLALETYSKLREVELQGHPNTQWG